MTHEGQVHQAVIRLEDGARSTVKGNGATMGIKQCGLTDILCLSVEGHNITRGSNPKGQMTGNGIGEIGNIHHLLMG